MIKKHLIFIVCMFWYSISTYAAYEESLLKEAITIKPKDRYVFKIPTTTKINIRWTLNDDGNCKSDCISAVQLNTENTFAATSQYGFGTHYSPIGGLVEIEYKNIANHPVKINILTYKYICDSFGCGYLKSLGIKNPIDYVSNDTPLFKRVRISKFTNIVTSDDKSWSRIWGVTEFGDNFKADFIWWKFDPTKETSCGSFLKMYKEKTIKNKTSVMFSGPILFNKKLDNIPVFYRVEGCTWKPLDFSRDKYDL